MARQMITIAYCDKTMDVEAYVSGKFAVHAPNGEPFRVMKPAFWYAVTHVATGRKVCEIQGRDAARRLARRLDTLLTEDITIDDFTGEWSPRYQAFLDAAKPLVVAARH